MDTSQNGPIFIGGLDRCGKTLLRALLVSHPYIAIPEIGSNYWTFFYKRYGDLGIAENFERCLEDMLQYTHVRLLNPDVERIRKEFWQGEPGYAQLFALFNQQYAEKQGKPRWGDQTGLVERFADEVIAAYPGARMLHLIRDPRDRYEASLALHPKGKGRVGAATARWLLSTRFAARNRHRYPQQYMIVYYETLVRQPEKTLQDICAFLGEEYTPAMLTMQGAPNFRAKVMRGEYGNTGPGLIAQNFIGRYRKSLANDEIVFMQFIAEYQMRAHGYKFDPLVLTPIESMLFFFYTLPVNLARMVSWLLVERVQRAFPQKLGRTPPADKIRLTKSTA